MNSNIRNDFQKAIESSKKSLFREIEYIVGSDIFLDIQFKYCVDLIDKIFLKIHSPITPPKSIKLLAFTFHKLTLAKNNRLMLICPLASETANKEIYYFLEFAKIFIENQLRVQVSIHFLIIKWEKLIDTSNKLNYDKRKKQYENQLKQIIEISQSIDCDIKVIPVDPDEEGLNVASYHFSGYFNKILKSCLEAKNLERELKRDIKWIVDFYERQNSFYRYGHEQAIYDLAIRRAIGNLYKQEYVHLQNQHNYLDYLMITSELHKRMILCYDSPIPIINIKIS